MQTMAGAYAEGQPVSDYVDLHGLPKAGDQAFYVDHETDEAMPKPILSMKVDSVDANQILISWKNLPHNATKDSLNNPSGFSIMPDMSSHLSVTPEGQVTEAYLSVADKHYFMTVTSPGANSPIRSREITYLAEPKRLTIDETTYTIDRISVEHWVLAEHNLEFLAVRQLSPEVPFEIVNWTLTGHAEIDTTMEGTAMSTLELANALYNPISAWDTFNKVMQLNKDHVRTIRIQQDWHYYPTLEAAVAKVEAIHKEKNERKPLLQKLFE